MKNCKIIIIVLSLVIGGLLVLSAALFTLNAKLSLDNSLLRSEIEQQR